MKPFEMMRRFMAAVGNWATTDSNTMNANNTGWAGYCGRISITPAKLAAGSKVRFTLKGPSAGAATVIAKAYFERQSGTYDFAAPPTQVLFSGNAGVTVPVGGSVVTDAISVAIDGTSNYILALDFTSGDLSRNTGVGGYAIYDKSSFDATTYPTASGYSAGTTTLHLISKIEIFQP